MADVKISALTALTTPDPTDVLPIVDLLPTPTTKKIAVSDLLAGATGAGGTGWVGPLAETTPIASNAASNSKARFFVTLTANRILGAPSNPVDGTVATFRIKQDSIGGRTLSLTADYIVPTDINVTLSTATNVTDILSAIYVQAVNKWIVIALTKGVVGI